MISTSLTAPAVDAGVDLDRIVQDYRPALAHLLLQLDDVRRDAHHRLGHDPVEHVSWRLKTPESIVAKARRKEIPLCDDGLRREMLDLAGLRLVCAFLSDLHGVRDAIVALPGVVLLDERDYVSRPKASGYRSLHLIVEVPVRRADGGRGVVVEIPLRTVAMDFWARLEHRLAYHDSASQPVQVTAALRRTALVARTLDDAMERARGRSRTVAAPPVPALASR